MISACSEFELQMNW